MIHWKWCGSPMTASESLWQNRLEVHLSEYPFSIRPLTIQTTLLVHSIFILPYRESFFAIQYLLAFTLAIGFYAYLKNLVFSQGWATFGTAVLLFCYPILAAHLEPMHTWDDFWSYLFLTLTFLFITKTKSLLSAITILLAVVARKQNLTFVPVY